MSNSEVALVFPDKRLWNDEIFAPSRVANTAGGLERWAHLRSALDSSGVSIHTHDVISKLGDADAFIVVDPTKSLLMELARSRVNPRRVILMVIEPPVIRRWTWRYMRYYAPFLAKIFVSDRARSRGSKIQWLPLPQPLDGFDRSDRSSFASKPKDGFMVMLRANKISDQPGELYGKRRELVRYFESRSDDLFDLYGPGWNDPNHAEPVMYRNHLGFAEGTVETYSRYKFTLGMDNSAVPGLLT